MNASVRDFETREKRLKSCAGGSIALGKIHGSGVVESGAGVATAPKLQLKSGLCILRRSEFERKRSLSSVMRFTSISWCHFQHLAGRIVFENPLDRVRAEGHSADF